MGWNQKKLRSAAGQIAKAVGKYPFEGKTADEFVKWLGEACEMRPVTYQGLIEDSEFDADSIRKAWKAVEITPTNGEEIILNEPPEMTEEADPEDEEVKELDEDEDENKAKSKKYKQLQKLTRELGIKEPTFMKSIHEASTKGAPAVHVSAERARRKAFDNAAKNGTLYRGKRVVFGSADEAEYFGAAARLMISKGGHGVPYSRDQYRNDCSIIGTKATGVTTDNAWAGTLIVSETAPQIIDLLHTYGAARQFCPITSMPDGSYDTKRKTSNMTFAYVSEGSAPSETNPAYDNVHLDAKKAAGIARVSMEMLNDSAFELGNEVAQSSAAGMALFEDQEYFLGSHGTHGGLAGNVDSNSTYDAALSSGWEDYTIPKLQAWVAKVPAEAWMKGTVKIACSTAFYQAVLRRFALSAGGNVGGALLDGVGGGYGWDGIPVVLSEVLPSTYSADQLVAYIGDGGRGSKFGVVSGSEALKYTDQRYWDTDEVAWMASERIDFNFHDVGGSTSEVIALKD